ncbi:MAG: WD40 repeat domain-containing protein [Verrucomicrobia bacterium]|nr:WD40 repeat domain-containing protein [Verrucomicrobiota bacterium]
MRHEAGVFRASFSPDGTRVVTASDDKTARVWDAASGKPVGEPMRHEAGVCSASFSSDGTRVVTASVDKTARVWDAASGKPLGEPMRHEDPVTSASFSPDGTRVVTACYDKTARVWDAASGKPVGEPMRHEDRVRSASFSPDGTRVVTASDDGTARVWELWQASDEPPTPEILEAFAGLKVNAEGQVVSIATEDRVSLVRDSLTQSADGSAVRRLLRWRFDDARARTLSPSSPITVTEHVEREIAWVMDHPKDANGPTILREAYEMDPGHPLIHIALAALEDAHRGRADFLRGYGLKRLPDDARICAKAAGFLNLLGDSARALSAAEKALKLDPGNEAAQSERANALELRHFLARKTAVAPTDWKVNHARFLPPGGGDLLVATADALYLQRPAGEPERLWATGQRIVNMACNRTGTLVGAMDAKGAAIIRRLSPATEQIACGEDEKIGPRGLVLGPDGTRWISINTEGRTLLREFPSGQTVAVLFAQRAGAIDISFTPDGRFIVGTNGAPMVWDGQSGQVVRKLTGHSNLVWKTAVAPQGDRAATVSADGTARLFDLTSGRELAVCQGHRSTVYKAGFRPDGRELVTASTDGTARIWSADGKELLKLDIPGTQVIHAGYSPDARWIATHSTDAKLRLWSVLTGQCLFITDCTSDFLESDMFSADGTKLVVPFNGSYTVFDLVKPEDS